MALLSKVKSSTLFPPLTLPFPGFHRDTPQHPGAQHLLGHQALNLVKGYGLPSSLDLFTNIDPNNVANPKPSLTPFQTPFADPKNPITT